MITSHEDLIGKDNKFLNFGKFRASYGTTGNDQIGDQFLDTYRSIGIPYQDPDAIVEYKALDSGQDLHPHDVEFNHWRKKVGWK